MFNSTTLRSQPTCANDSVARSCLWWTHLRHILYSHCLQIVLQWMNYGENPKSICSLRVIWRHCPLVEKRGRLRTVWSPSWLIYSTWWQKIWKESQKKWTAAVMVSSQEIWSPHLFFYYMSVVSQSKYNRKSKPLCDQELSQLWLQEAFRSCLLENRYKRSSHGAKCLQNLASWFMESSGRLG